MKELSPPYTDEEMKPDPTPAPGPPDPNPEPTPEPIPNPIPSPPSPKQKEMYGDFFDKRSRNRASSGLGSSFYTTAF